MINIIGAKRIIILLVLLAFNAVLASAIYLYALPQKDETDRKIRTLRSQSSAVQSDIDRMQLEFEQLDKQQDAFNALKDSGFFNAQDRSNAKDMMKAIQEESRIISAVASIKSGYIAPNPEAEKAAHFILVSPVEIDIKAFDDADIYRYLATAQRKFPGVLSVEKIEIKRNADISAPILRAIAAGANPELVSAHIVMTWKTMVPQTAFVDDAAATGGQ